jgi:hypothetical protein
MRVLEPVKTSRDLPRAEQTLMTWLPAVLALAACSRTPPQPVPVPDSRLSILQQEPDACLWREVDPADGTDRLLARAWRNCNNAALAFSPDGRHALLYWVDPPVQKPPQGVEMWEAGVEGPAVRRTPPDPPAVLGYDAHSVLGAYRFQFDGPGVAEQWADSLLGRTAKIEERLLILRSNGSGWKVTGGHPSEIAAYGSWVLRMTDIIRSESLGPSPHLPAFAPTPPDATGLARLDPVHYPARKDWKEIGGCSRRVFWESDGHQVYVLRGEALEMLPDAASLFPGCRGKFLQLVTDENPRAQEWDLDSVSRVLETRGDFADFWQGPPAKLESPAS